MITNNLLWSEGRAIAIVLPLIAAFGFVFFKPLLYVSIVLFVLCFYFFRNPDRKCVEAEWDSHVIVSPADGRVVEITSLDNGEYGYKISIFMSPLNVHVNRIPYQGVIIKTSHRAGKFYPGYAPKSSELNEAHDIEIHTSNGQQYKVRQIAGMIARRIVCNVKTGDEVFTGQRFGMIKFSSRIDLFLPSSAMIEVKVGDVVYGGQTVIARWNL